MDGFNKSDKHDPKPRERRSASLGIMIGWSLVRDWAFLALWTYLVVILLVGGL